MNSSHPLPLEGVRILAIEQMQAMPYCTQLLARLGADVVKVEHPVHGESGRGAAPSIGDEDGSQTGATFLRNNLSKRSVGIDLKNAKGVELVKRLVPHYDIVTENFKPGTMDRLGLGYEALAEVHPPLVYVAISGFGSLRETPYGDWPAYALVPEAMGGLYSFRPEGRPPNIGMAGALGDIGSGLFAAIGLLSALRSAEKTGVGQKVDIAMFDVMVAIMDMVAFNPSMGVMDNSVSAWPGISTAFQAKDGLFVMQVGREHQFERLAKAVGHPEWLEDERFATREGWRDHVDSVIRPAIEEWARDKTKLEAATILAEQQVVAGPSYGAEDLLSDPHVASHEMIVSIERPDTGTPLHVHGNPIKLSKSPEGPAEKWPTVGAHTQSVLEADLKLGEDDLRALREAGAIR